MVAMGQGVNTQGKMGAGIAKVFRQEFPEMYEAYVEECRGGFLLPGQCFLWEESDDRLVLNIASQRLTGADATMSRLRNGLLDAIDALKPYALREFAIPRIGCGIGGLEWDEARELISEIARSEDVDIEVWFKP